MGRRRRGRRAAGQQHRRRGADGLRRGLRCGAERLDHGRLGGGGLSGGFGRGLGRGAAGLGSGGLGSGGLGRLSGLGGGGLGRGLGRGAGGLGHGDWRRLRATRQPRWPCRRLGGRRDILGLPGEFVGRSELRGRRGWRRRGVPRGVGVLRRRKVLRSGPVGICSVTMAHWRRRLPGAPLLVTGRGSYPLLLLPHLRLRRRALLGFRLRGVVEAGVRVLIETGV
mmetsp:Transcript_46291/g.104929  ORF Transcript_46291/g.104929 Transcript_46291/m.104929 type:complete len:224 (-) Transcript_46291:51-722(-)